MASENVLRQTDRFRALGGDGVIYIIVEYTHATVISRFPGDPSPAVIEGAKEYFGWPRCIPVAVNSDIMEMPSKGVQLKRL